MDVSRLQPFDVLQCMQCQGFDECEHGHAQRQLEGHMQHVISNCKHDVVGKACMH